VIEGRARSRPGASGKCCLHSRERGDQPGFAQTLFPVKPLAETTRLRRAADDGGGQAFTAGALS
jgi:hypothetical protein